jgi:hypothetical protein
VSSLGPVREQLVCPACGVVLAEAVHRRWLGTFRLEWPDGPLLQPSAGAILLRAAQAQAVPDEDRIEFIRRDIGELMYDLRCRNGHATLRTMPQVVRAVRQAQGRWVDLRLS